jgi:integrase
MGRPNKPYWHEGDGCYRTVIGGRCRLLRGIAKGDETGARRKLGELLRLEAEAERHRLDPTVDRLCLAYLAWQQEHGGLAKVTLRGHKDHLAKFAEFAHAGTRYGDRRAAAITATDLGRVRAALEREGKGALHVYKSVLACWNWAARPVPFREPEVILERNPLAGIARPPQGARTDRDASPGELARFLRHAWRDVNLGWPPGTRGRCMACMAARRAGPCQRDHSASTRMLRDAVLMLRLIAETGMRPGEACGARWGGWTPRAYRDEATGQWWGLLTVEHKMRRFTGGKPRKVLVPPLMARAIERIRRREGRHPEFLFAHRRGKATTGTTAAGGAPWNTTAFGRRLRRWRQGAEGVGKDFVSYSLRHRYFSDVAPTIDAERAAMVGGNSAAVVRRVYLRARTAELGRAAAEGRRGRRRPA